MGRGSQQEVTMFFLFIVAAVVVYYSYQKGYLKPLIDSSVKFINDLLGGALSTPVTSTPTGPITPGALLWDSNTHGGWNNGVKRTVSGTEGNQSANGKGIFTAASGSPKLEIDGDGVSHLVAGSGHGRIYVKATNYNSVLEGEFMFESSAVDNFSIKTRSRHGETGACENRFGGAGGHIERNGGGFKIEKCHNVHESGSDFQSPVSIQDNEWHSFRYTVTDTADGKGIFQKMEIDGKEVGSTTFSNPPAYYLDRAKFMQESYFWLRSNNSGNGSIALRNIRLVEIGPVAAQAQASMAFMRSRRAREISDNYNMNVPLIYGMASA